VASKVFVTSKARLGPLSLTTYIQDGILRSTTREGYMKEFLRGGQSLVTLWGTTEKEIADMESALQRLK